MNSAAYEVTRIEGIPYLPAFFFALAVLGIGIWMGWQLRASKHDTHRKAPR